MPTHPEERGSTPGGEPSGEESGRRSSPAERPARPARPPNRLPWNLEDSEPPAPRRLLQGTPRTTVLILLLMILATASLVWIAGEQHYQSCAVAQSARFGQGNDPLTRLGRTNALSSCSRWPF